MVRESTLMTLHYITAAIMVVVLTIHVLMHTPVLEAGYEVSLEYEKVLEHYNIAWLDLAILLYAALFHGLNGLRVILIELHQGPVWEKAVSWILLIVGIVAAIYGTWTLIEVV